MNYHLFIKTILPFLFFLPILSGCTDDKVVDNSSNVGEVGIPVRVDLKFNIPELEIPSKTDTRAQSLADTLGEGWHVISDVDKYRVEYKSSANTRVDEEAPETQALLNLWILQFGPDKNVRKVIQVPNTPDPVHETATIDAELFTGENQTIYLVVLGKQYNSSTYSLSGIKTITELESYSLPTARYVNGIATPMITTAEDVPYSGSTSGLNIVSYEKDGRGYIKYNPSTGFTGAIPLKAIVSKVTFNFSYKVNNLTPNLLMLNNIPADYTIVTGTVKPSKMINFPAIELKASDFSDGKRYEVSWYMPANKQGVVSSITKESERYYYYTTKVEGTAPPNGTYINLWALDSQLANNYALYYIFLGSNTTNDFNVHPNSHYKVRSDINIAPSIDDKRVIKKELKQTIDIFLNAVVTGNGNSSWSTDGMLTRTGQAFNPHAGIQPFEVTALRGLVKVDVLATATSTDPIPTADSWLHLSIYPNYTEAYNQNKGGDSQALTTSLTLDVPIPQLFKLYMYNEEWEEYTEDNPSSEPRIIYLRFTFQTSTGVSKKYVCSMRQVRGSYLGQYGGERNPDTGVYEEGLVGEYLADFPTTASNRILSYHTVESPYIYRGSYNVPNYTYMRDLYNADNRDNGKKSTLLHAININASSTYKLQDTSSGIPETPVWKNGKVDLYQYKGYLFDSFAMRVCYDKNRDDNGNGVIDEEEYKWYMPSYYQVLTIGLGHPTYYAKNVYTIMTATSLARYSIYAPMPQNLNQNSTSISSKNTGFRCVRNIKLTAAPTNENRSIKVYKQDGYAAIDASGLPTAIVKTIGSDYVDANGRVVRHNSTINIDDNGSPAFTKVSTRFIVAPSNIDAAGAPVLTNDAPYKVMTWAEAAGFDTAGNALPVSEPLNTAETGCSNYRGKNGIDAAGTWRLPNTKEMALIDMMEKALINTSSSTGYIPLYYLLGEKSDKSGYWTATEASVSDTGGTSAIRLLSYETTGVDGTQYRNITTGTKSTGFAARCIRDLP